MNKEPVTKEGLNRLLESTEQTIVALSRNIDEWIHYKETLPTILNTFKNSDENEISSETKNDALSLSQIDKDFTEICDLLSFSIHLSYLYCDLASLLRFCLSAKLGYEQRFAAKYFNVIMSEGYKRIYGFESKQKDNQKSKQKDKKKGKEKCQVEESFWVKTIKPICLAISPEWVCRYETIEKKLIDLRCLFDKDKRDFAVHGDKDVNNVYKMLKSLNLEEEAIKMSEFLKYIEELVFFTRDIITQKGKEFETSNNSFLIQIDKYRELLQTLQDKCSEESKTQCGEMVKKFDELFAKFENFIKP
jgi:hypothetical protein